MIERIVLDNIRLPNRESHTAAFLEGARGTKMDSPFREKMTLSCLADGVGMNLGMFIGFAKSLVHFLRHPPLTTKARIYPAE